MVVQEVMVHVELMEMPDRVAEVVMLAVQVDKEQNVAVIMEMLVQVE
jgi:hypothetical protein